MKTHFYTPKKNLITRFISNAAIVLLLTTSIGLLLSPVDAYSCAPPSQPGAIIGNATACSGTTQIYSVIAVPGATSYTWTVPYGWAGYSTRDSITLKAGLTAGNITVTANDSCGSSIAQTIAVTANSVPVRPGTIYGTAAVCSGSPMTYNIISVSGATSYTWTMPADWTGASTDTSMSATTGSLSGMITVKANNTCGSSSSKTLTVTAADSAPATPGNITGSTIVCSGTYQIYSISPVTRASSYTWTVPSGWAGYSSSRSIQVKVGTTGGTISVVANGSCGSSSANTLVATVNTVPAMPSLMTVSGGIDHVCNGDGRSYSVTLVPAVTYNWSVPSGATIDFGQGTDSIAVSYGAGFAATGVLICTPSNSCGLGQARRLPILRNLPAAPGAITISGGITKVCSGDQVTYSVVATAGNTYTWTPPTGAIVISGQGTHIARLAYTNGFTAQGTLKCSAVNACGAGTPSSITIYRNTLANLGSINGPAKACANTSASYNVAGVTSGAVTYNWTVPDSAVIDSGQGATRIYISWIGAGGGTISLYATNACGSTPVRSFIVGAGSCGRLADDVNNDGIKAVVYPNPASASATVEFLSTSGSNYSVKLFDVTGREVFTKEGIAEEGRNVLALDLTGYTKGMYVLHLQSGNTKEVIKLAIQ